MSESFDIELIEDIASRMDLRDPNKEALETVAFATTQYFEIDRHDPPFEAVLDSATGVGKTYAMAASMEYFALHSGTRNFAVITPGSTILNKTIDNFTPGHRKGLLGGMVISPMVITADNFASPVVRSAMDDSSVVKLFVFTVQALLKPKARTGRKTRKFQEGLGSALYDYLLDCEDLVVFADEHHCYYGKAFSEAVRGISPRVLLGLTATPHKRTPKEQIIFRYPLAAAIAEEYVKIPVIVGRTDDREDTSTKLHDAISLLDLKQQAIERYCETSDHKPFNATMLVVAKSIEEANDYGDLFVSDVLGSTAYKDSILVVTSDSSDKALEALQNVEEESSPVRIIISVGMLKEGWDVKSVYVIASMRASVSEVLTEQTLGRGLRLPFGKRTGIEFLDTVEVLAHERYEDVLKKAGVLNEQFVSHRTRTVLVETAKGEKVAKTQSRTESAPVLTPTAEVVDVPSDGYAREHPTITTTTSRTGFVSEQTRLMRITIAPRADYKPIQVPRLRQTITESQFQLADITDMNQFWRLGEQIAQDPEEFLRRTLVSAEVVVGADGMRRTELVTQDAADKVEAHPELFPLDQLRKQLTDDLLASPAVPARKSQRAMAAPIVTAFVDGLGGKAESVLSAHYKRASGRLVQLVNERQKLDAPPPSYAEVVDVVTLDGTRTNARPVTKDRHGTFKKSSAYEGWLKSIYPVEWFDSSTERTLAAMLDTSDEIASWVRLQQNDLPILWRNDGRQYNADFIAIEVDGTHWVVESKMNKEMTSEEVQGKREAAKRWVNYVNADPTVAVTWAYLLASETNISEARGSWGALKVLGTT
ncbi:MAG: DEAD/DEAH box helicase family protein [Pseudomonadota bacterium]